MCSFRAKCVVPSFCCRLAKNCRKPGRLYLISLRAPSAMQKSRILRASSLVCVKTSLSSFFLVRKVSRKLCLGTWSAISMRGTKSTCSSVLDAREAIPLLAAADDLDKALGGEPDVPEQLGVPEFGVLKHDELFGSLVQELVSELLRFQGLQRAFLFLEHGENPREAIIVGVGVLKILQNFVLEDRGVEAAKLLLVEGHRAAHPVHAIHNYKITVQSYNYRMKISVSLLVILLGYVMLFLQSHDPYTYFCGVVTTFLFEGLLFMIIIQLRSRNRIGKSQLSIHFKEALSSIEQTTNFQSYIPEDTNRMSDDEVSLSEYQPSIDESMSEDPKNENPQPKANKSRIQQQADLYINQLKNYFGMTKIPFNKLKKKEMILRFNNLHQFTQITATYYQNLEKALDPFTQISQITKYILNKDFAEQKGLFELLDQKDQTLSDFSDHQADLLQRTLQIQSKSVALPYWTQIKNLIKQLSTIQHLQKQHLHKAAEPQITMILKSYQDSNKQIKKQKAELLSRYNEICRKQQQYQNQIQLLDRDIEQLNNLKKELKKFKSEPEKLIKTEMNLKLLVQQLQTAQHKLNDSNYALKEFQPQLDNLDAQLQEFIANWNRQYNALQQTIVRSLLQAHYENYQQFMKSFKSLIKAVTLPAAPCLASSPSHPGRITRQRTSIDETDPVRLMRNERTELQEFLQKFSNYDEKFGQIDKFNLDILQLILEISESAKRCSLEDLKIPYSKQESDWAIQIFEKGLPKQQLAYQNAYNQLKRIVNSLTEQRLKLMKDHKETQISVKERINQITYLFNCILKDSEKFNPSKSKSLEGFTDYQKQRQHFQESYQQYVAEADHSKQRLLSYELRYQELLEQNNSAIVQAKFQTLLTLLELSRSILMTTLQMMDQIDENFEKTDDFSESLAKLQSNKPSAKFQEKEALETLQAKGSSRSGSIAKKNAIASTSETVDKSMVSQVNQAKETFVLKQMIRILFLQWTKSLCFRQKIMTELYRSLNKKRPTQLEEIYVTNIDIGGEPPDIVHFIPHKSSNLNTCVFDLEIVFRGHFNMDLETKVSVSLLKRQLPLNLKVRLTSLNGRLRLFYTPSFVGRSWFAFVGEPVMNLAIMPSINNYDITNTFSFAKDILREFIIYKIRMLTYPNKESIQVPLSDYETEIPKYALDRIQEFVNRLKITGGAEEDKIR